MSVSDLSKLDEITEQRTLVAGWPARIPLCAGIPNQLAQPLSVRVSTTFQNVAKRRIALVEQARAPTFRTVQ